METRLIQDSAQLASRLPQKVLVPTDNQYETACLAWNLVAQQHPAVIVFVESPLDVIEAITFARQHKMPVAVQCTGHAGLNRGDGAMLINTSHMKELRIVPELKTAWVGAGVKWGEVLHLAQQHGLAPMLGSSSDVGAVGYTLGGGMGYLSRKYGMSADNVLRFEIVTPDGNFRRASQDENPDLFWALRGGGGGFGVVTGMEIRLHPVQQVYAGRLYYPPEIGKDVIRRFRTWALDAPDELTSTIAVMNFPPLPELPEFLSGKSFVIMQGCYCGPVEEGEKMIETWRSWQAPLFDEFRSIPFTMSDVISQDPVDPTPIRLVGGWLRDLSDDTIDTLLHYSLPQGGPPIVVQTEIRAAGGAISRADPGSSAFTNRNDPFNWLSLTVPMSPEDLGPITRHIEQMKNALAPALSGKLYMNFTDAADLPERTRDGFSEKAFRLLQEIKAKYDPDRMFRFGYHF